MTIGWYNGWSPEQRLATVPIQREAIRSGALPRPTHCSICGIAHQRGGANPVWLHDEDYADPLAAYPICRRCHRVLHERFAQPEPWLVLVAANATPDRSRWFEQLTMDPASLRKPFALTYPRGLKNQDSDARLRADHRSDRLNTVATAGSANGEATDAR